MSEPTSRVNRHPAPAGAHDPLLPTVVPVELMAEIARRGGDPRELASTFGLASGPGRPPFVMMPLSRVRAFGEAAARLAGDDFLGLHAGANGGSRSGLLTTLAFACSGARTGREALELYVKYLSTVHDAMVFTLHERGAGMELRQKIAGHPECTGRHGNELWVATVLSAGQVVSGIRAVPAAVWFAHAAPARREEIVRVLGTTSLTFDAGHNALLFTREHLEAPVNNTGSDVAAVLGRYSDRTTVLPPAVNAFVAQVRDAIEGRLPAGAPSVDDVARKVGMSARTLQRRLSEESLTFVGVLDGVRRDIALSLLERPDLSLDEIAARIGYAQKSAFFRSFRRWTGKTPRSKGVPPAGPPSAPDPRSDHSRQTS